MNASTTPDPQYAQALARHIKAALMHLRQADDLAELAGIDIYAGEHDVPEAGLLRAAGEAAEDLDTWAINNARTAGADAADTYQHTERWCQAEGGHLPAGSWPGEPGPGALETDIEEYRNRRDARARAEQDRRDREKIAVMRGLNWLGDGLPARAEKWAELARLRYDRETWEEAVRACTCPGPADQCTRGDFRDHAGESEGCMVCADLDPDQPCYADVARRLEAGQ